MRIAVTGSLAADHLTPSPGMLSEQLAADRPENTFLSFLAEDLEVRREGTAPGDDSPEVTRGLPA